MWLKWEVVYAPHSSANIVCEMFSLFCALIDVDKVPIIISLMKVFKAETRSLLLDVWKPCSTSAQKCNGALKMCIVRSLET